MNLSADSSRVVALIVLRSIIKCSCLDNCGNLIGFLIVHIKEELLGFAKLRFVVVDKKVSKDPLIELNPSPEAAAELAGGPCTALVPIGFFLLLIRVESGAVLASEATDIASVAIDILLKVIFREEECLHAADGGAEEDGGEDDESEASRDDHRAVLHIATIDTQDETEGDRAADQSSVTDEKDLLPSDARFVST